MDMRLVLDQTADALPCLALPCLALPCLALACLALPCLALPCLALPCLALPCRRGPHVEPDRAPGEMTLLGRGSRTGPSHHHVRGEVRCVQQLPSAQEEGCPVESESKRALRRLKKQTQDSVSRIWRQSPVFPFSLTTSDKEGVAKLSVGYQ